jgi:hypothetical protein
MTRADGIVTIICVTFELNIMKLREYGLLFAVLLILFACMSGCTMTRNAGSAGPVATTTGPASPTYTQVPSASLPAASRGIDTTIDIHYNDFLCLDVQKEMGADYLYPDQKYAVWATSPASGTVNVNVLLLTASDYEKIQTVRPVWDTVKKTWFYEGIAPLIQLNDITVPQEKTVTLKTQGKYYLCADDRKESGTSDVIFRVPVKMKMV